MSNELVTPVIMCGGAGTRLWPVSRERRPKQFVPLIGNESTFQQVLHRVRDPQLFGRPIVVTSQDFAALVAEQLQQCGTEADIVLEPARRESGPAVAVGAKLAFRRNSEAIVLVLAADHVILQESRFHESCRQAALAAAKGYIVTFGIRPTFPATNYGYIRPDRELEGGGAFRVGAFVEKPDVALALEYIGQNYLWNSGNFMFRADVMLEELAHYEPGIIEAVTDAIDSGDSDSGFFRLAENPFSRAPKKSIDYAVMERTTRAVVVSADWGWSDIGSWNAVWEMLTHDNAGNAVDGPVAVIGSRNCLVRANKDVLTTLVGVDNLIVISTGDAVLVVAREQAESVKQLVEALKTQERPEVTGFKE